MTKQFITKDYSASVSDFDMKTGIVTLYASAFGNIDIDGDIIVKGAYAKTITERGERIKHLYQHDIYNIIGRPVSMVEDEKGLRIDSFITESKNGDYRKLYAEGLITEHSVGIAPIQTTMAQEARYITEVKLYEYSAVTWGANPLTPVIGMKGEILKPAQSLISKLEKLEAFVKRSDATDETLQMMEIEIKKLQTELYALVKAEPGNHSTEGKPLEIPNLITLYNSL